jgi:pentatricopeptide repeat protein
VFVGNSIVDTFAKYEAISYTRKMFDEILEKQNVISWTNMINGYAQLGEDKKTLGLFKQTLFGNLNVNNFLFC